MKLLTVLKLFNFLFQKHSGGRVKCKLRDFFSTVKPYILIFFLVAAALWAGLYDRAARVQVEEGHRARQHQH